MKEQLIEYLTRRIIMYSRMIETSKNEVDRGKMCHRAKGAEKRAG